MTKTNEQRIGLLKQQLRLFDWPIVLNKVWL